MQLITTFSGIGGFELAAEWMGWDVMATCDINPYCRKILHKHCPHVYHHGDIHTLTRETLDTELNARFGTRWRADELVLAGGFP